MITPQKITGFIREYTGLLAPDGEFYYCGNMGHTDLAHDLLEQIYNESYCGNSACEQMFSKGWFEIRQLPDELWVSPYLGRYTCYDDKKQLFMWPTAKQLESLRLIESIANLKYDNLRFVDDAEYYLWELQQYEGVSKSVELEIKEKPKLLHSATGWYKFWCCVESSDNTLLQETMFIKAQSLLIAQEVCYDIHKFSKAGCIDCERDYLRQVNTIETPESHIELHFNHWNFMSGISIVDTEKQIYWCGTYANYMSQLHEEGLQWQVLIIK